MSEVLILRLLSGEEILGSVIRNDNENRFEVDAPFHVVVTRGQNNQIDVQFSPALPLGKHNKMTINYDVVVCAYEPADELANRYKSVTTKIILPTKSGIITPK
jgi:hypothetical protein